LPGRHTSIANHEGYGAAVFPALMMLFEVAE